MSCSNCGSICNVSVCLCMSHATHMSLTPLTCTQETWEKRLSYIQVVVELVAGASHRKETHSHSYSDPISHLFQTAVDVCVLGIKIYSLTYAHSQASLPGLIPRPHIPKPHLHAIIDKVEGGGKGDLQFCRILEGNSAEE